MEDREEYLEAVRSIRCNPLRNHSFARISLYSACQNRFFQRISFSRLCTSRPWSYHVNGVSVGLFRWFILTQFFNELRILRRLQHPHLVHFYGDVIDAEARTIMFVFEYKLEVTSWQCHQLLDGQSSAMRYRHNLTLLWYTATWNR